MGGGGGAIFRGGIFPEGQFSGGQFSGVALLRGEGIFPRGIFPRTDNSFTINILHAINHLSIYEKSFLNNSIVNKIEFVYWFN